MIKQVGQHTISHNDIQKVNFNELLQGRKAQILYTDPPWGDGNMSYWCTINKRHTGTEIAPMKYTELIQVIKNIIVNNVDGYVFLETGNKWLAETEEALKDVLFNTQSFSLTYKAGSSIRTNPVIVGTTNPSLTIPKEIAQLEGALDEKSLQIAIPILAQKGAILLDPCCGMGNSARQAIASDMVFVGNEFNAKRLLKTENSLLKTIK